MKRTAMLLLALAIAVPAVATERRHASFPVAPPCSEATLAAPYFANDIAVDANAVYFTDDLGGLYRLPKITGTGPLRIAQLTDGSAVLAITVDDASVYFTNVATDTFLSSIYAVPKNGGATTVLANGVVSPVELLADSDYLYWNGLGTPSGEDFLPDGTIERMRKDGTNRTTLASGLSYPLAIAIDGDNVLFSETGLAAGSTSAGLRSVPKSGGTVTNIIDGAPVLGIAVTPANYIVGLIEPPFTGTIASVNKTSNARARLASEPSGIPLFLRVGGDQLYYYFLSDTDSIRAVPLAGGDARVLKSGEFATPKFALDACSLYYGSFDSNTGFASIVRTPR